MSEHEPTRAERELWRRVARFWADNRKLWSSQEKWFEREWSLDAIHAREAQRADQLSKELPGAPKVEAHIRSRDSAGFHRVDCALRELIAVKNPWMSREKERREYGLELLYVTRLATDPDCLWMDAHLYDDHVAGSNRPMLQRALVLLWALEHARDLWRKRVREALLEVENATEKRTRDARPRAGSASHSSRGPERQEPRAPKGWIFLQDAAKQQGVPRSTLQGWIDAAVNERRLASEEIYKDLSINRKRITEKALRALMEWKGRTPL
jgi:hypothetical protein